MGGAPVCPSFAAMHELRHGLRCRSSSLVTRWVVSLVHGEPIFRGSLAVALPGKQIRWCVSHLGFTRCVPHHPSRPKLAGAASDICMFKLNASAKAACLPTLAAQERLEKSFQLL